LVKRGGRPARLRLAFWTMVAGIAGTLLAIAGAPTLVFALVGLWIFASTSGQSLGLTVLQEIAPGDARGLSVSIASLVNIGIGLAVGAALPPWILDHVLGDPAQVGAAVTIVALPCALASTWLYRTSLRALVRSEAA
jgi:predicted MFS family arabinose efflux permease